MNHGELKKNDSVARTLLRESCARDRRKHITSGLPSKASEIPLKEIQIWVKIFCGLKHSSFKAHKLTNISAVQKSVRRKVLTEVDGKIDRHNK